MGDQWKRRSKGFDDFDLKDLRNLRMGRPLKYGLMAFVGGTLAVCMCGLLITACVAFMIFNRDQPQTPAQPTERVIRSVVSPNGRITARVINERDGASGSCALRVDLETAERTLRDVYRSDEFCDAALEWEGSNLLFIRDPTGTDTQLDMRELGL